jgi:hypothetical protein
MSYFTKAPMLYECYFYFEFFFISFPGKEHFVILFIQ